MSMTAFSCRSYFVAIECFDFSIQSRYAYCRSGSAAAKPRATRRAAHNEAERADAANEG